MREKTPKIALLLFFASDDDLRVTRLFRLPVLLCWLLAAAGLSVSSSAAWVIWTGKHSPTKEQLLQIIPAAEALSVPSSAYWLVLADLDPDREEAHLRAAIQSNPRELKALLRLALIAEFSGDRPQALKLIDQATGYHRSFKSYMAALTQAARWQDAPRMERFALLALQYCPRDADGIFAQLADSAMAKRVLAQADPKWSTDYLRFLIGQGRLTDALRHQANLPKSPQVDRYRLELCDRLFWSGQKREASELFGATHPAFAADGFFNLQLRTQPTSLGFDWRLSQHAKTSLNWRPGEIEVKALGHSEPLELMSILVEVRKKPLERVIPSWSGDTDGLYWQWTEAGPAWKRLALVAPAGNRERRFRLMEVHFE